MRPVDGARVAVALTGRRRKTDVEARDVPPDDAVHVLARGLEAVVALVAVDRGAPVVAGPNDLHTGLARADAKATNASEQLNCGLHWAGRVGAPTWSTLARAG